MLKQLIILSRYLSLLILALGLSSCGGSGSATTADNPTYFKASNTGMDDYFGAAVSLSADGNTLAVGTWGEDSSATGIGSTSNNDGTAYGSGAVYIFIRIDNAWIEQAYVKSSNTGTNDLFGFRVSLSADGNTLAVSAPMEDSNTTGIGSTSNDDGSADDSGAVYIFTRTGTSWTEQAYVKASNTEVSDQFGTAVSLSADGNTLAVGAHFEGSNTTGVDSIPNDDGFAHSSGAVYVFARAGTAWAQQAYVKASNNGAFDNFGIAVSLNANGNTLVVGAHLDDSNTTGIDSTPNDDGAARNSGAAYVFTRSGTTWSEQAYIKASNIGVNYQFGAAVSLNADGNTLAIGAWAENSNTTGVGSIPNDDGSADLSGAVYVFNRTGTAWTEQAYVKASNTGADDSFGSELSLSGDGNTLAVGAIQEDSNTTGVGSTPNDDMAASNSGAAYTFARVGTIWAEQAYVKASNTGARDAFGIAVSLSENGNTLAVGAQREDSNTTGVGSTPNDDGSANNSGAVYLY